MAFGIGTNTEHTVEPPPEGLYQPVAVKCWYTASGDSIPLTVKMKTTEDDIIQIDHLQMLTRDKHWYAGIVTYEYKCLAHYKGKECLLRLMFWPEECKWKIIDIY